MKVRLGDIEVAYTRQGEGSPVVMVHGLAEDRWSWADVQTKLSEFATYTYDFPPESLTFEARVGDTVVLKGGRAVFESLGGEG